MNSKKNITHLHFRLLVLICVLFLFTGKISTGQDYLISFSGEGESTTVDSVQVQNLTRKKSVSLQGSDTLHLRRYLTSVPSLPNNKDYELTIYPNPFSNYCKLEFGVSQPGVAQIHVFDLVGRKIVNNTHSVKAGINSFRLTGLTRGMYVVEVRLPDKVYSAKLINSGTAFAQNGSLEYVGVVSDLDYIDFLKSGEDEKELKYTVGDLVLFKGYSSGKYITIVVDTPTVNKEISFEFVECTDVDGNHYPVVKIGDQFWMAENLKTTKYNDGTIIPNVSDENTWSSLTSDAYCWYNNNPGNKNNYGALYNWYAVGTNKLAPKGWRIPTDEEWNILSNSLGADSAAVKLKDTDDAHWIAHNEGVFNETGFTALPAGYRDSLGISKSIGEVGRWWTATVGDSIFSGSKGMNNEVTAVVTNWVNRNIGNSVRCIRTEDYDVSTLATSEASSVDKTTASIGGSINSDGGANVTARGVCWGTNPNPTIADKKTNDGAGIADFTSSLTGLTTGTTYYARAYATNLAGTSYGEQVTFTTDYLLQEVSNIEIPDVHPDDEGANVYRIISLKRIVEEFKQKSSSGTTCCMYGLQRIEGFYFDSEKKDVFLYGKSVNNNNWPEITFFDFIESLKNVTSSAVAPYCSLDPKPEGIEALNNYLDTLLNSNSNNTVSSNILKSARISDKSDDNGLANFDINKAQQLFGGQQCIVGGVAPKSNFAYEMIFADYEMKKVSQGIVKLEGVKSIWDHFADEDYNSEMGMSRFWFNVDGNYPKISENGDLVKISELPIQVTTEAIGLNEEGELVDIGSRDSISVRFARGFTSKFDSSALQIDHFAALENMYHLQAACLALKQKNIIQENNEIFNYFLHEFPLIQTVNFPDELPGLISTLEVTKVSGQQSTKYLFILAGGADLYMDIEFQTDQSTGISEFSSKIKDATKQIYDNGWNAATFNTVEDTIREHVEENDCDVNLWFDFINKERFLKEFPEIFNNHTAFAA